MKYLTLLLILCCVIACEKEAVVEYEDVELPKFQMNESFFPSYYQSYEENQEGLFLSLRMQEERSSCQKTEFTEFYKEVGYFLSVRQNNDRQTIEFARTDQGGFVSIDKSYKVFGKYDIQLNTISSMQEIQVRVSYALH